MQAQLTTPTFGDERLPARFWAKVRVGSVPVHRPDLGPCWEWVGVHSNGYGQFRVGSRTDGSRRMIRAHRFAYETLVGPIPEGLEPDHLCRNRPCVRPEHIEPVTSAINSRRSPIMPKGEANSQAKLKAADIPVIRALRGQARCIDLARRYGVGKSLISRIQRGERWTHVV